VDIKVMKLIVLSLTAAVAVTVPGPAKAVLKLSGFMPGGLELTGANENYPPFRQTGARPSVRVVATARPFSVRAR
jgi:hypothetical protein